MKKNYVILISGLILSLVMISTSLIAQQKCTQNIGCIIFTIIPLFPGLILNAGWYTSLVISSIFWFLLGSLIGFLVYKIKK